MRFIKWFDEISLDDIPIVGGKNAAIGYMASIAQEAHIRVPNGFAVTVQAYWRYLDENNLSDSIYDMLETLDIYDSAVLNKASKSIRERIEKAEIPEAIAQEISQAYRHLSKEYKTKNLDVAIRSSATAEDLPGASFAGQQESFLHISGVDSVLASYKKAISSLFTARAIVYRIEKGFEHKKVGISVGIQKMVRADKASSGVLFTIDTETGFKDVVIINAAFGLGEAIVGGLVNPDEFWVHKPTLFKGFKPILRKNLGSKEVKVVYGTKNKTKKVKLKRSLSDAFSLADNEILTLARQATDLERFFNKQSKHKAALDIEWAKDGIDGKIYILQSRPETVHSQLKSHEMTHYFLEIDPEALRSEILLTGQSIGQQIVHGKVRIAESVKDLGQFHKGDILVTNMTDPDWVPIMKRAGAIVTNIGGRTSHAAIVSRELGIPALIGTGNATSVLKDTRQVTVDCSQGITGYIYDGKIPFGKQKVNLKKIPKAPVDIMINIADPDTVFRHASLPVAGVGLARVEFIIANQISFHPLLACIDKIPKKLIPELSSITRGYQDVASFFFQTMAMGIASIAAAFYPKFVLVRFSDFKSNEYRNLLGGTEYEPVEENPMLGLRGASRYYDPRFEPTFAMECKIIDHVRSAMGFKNVSVMVPFVRTLSEADTVLKLLKKYGVTSGKENPKIYMMCEVPSNVFLMQAFAQKFDGMSIGSNDLTQLVLAVDRDSQELSGLFDEHNQAVLDAMKRAIQGSHAEKKPIGICGQAPSDYPDIASFLIKEGIDSISLNPDAVIQFLQNNIKQKPK